MKRAGEREIGAAAGPAGRSGSGFLTSPCDTEPRPEKRNRLVPMSNLFADVSIDPARFRADMQRRGARKTYGIFFTPRSGSSWLTDVITGTGRLGKPEEWFNPSFVPRIARSVNAACLTDYVKMLKRKQAPGGVFGFEVTYYQMLSTFGDEQTFLAEFPAGTPAFFLMREDIVLQAVSLAKSVSTSVYHSPGTPEEELGRSDREFAYDARAIEHWLAHILDQELRFEQFFARNGLHPVRFSYEQMMATGRDGFLVWLAMQLGEPADAIPPAEEGHRKIGTGKNLEFAERFARENPRFLEAVARRRRDTLAALGQEAAGAA